MLCMVEELNERRLRILHLLARRSVVGSAPPSVREIGGEVGLKSKQTVFHHIRKLEESGFVERAADWTKALSLTERGWEAVGETPLMGRIAAGRGLEAVATEEAYSLAGEMLLSHSGKKRYLLRVVGDSMIEAHIAEGDLLIVEETQDPQDGTVVVALLADSGGEPSEVTVKRLHRRRGNSGNLIVLSPENAAYEEIVCEEGEVEVQGRVVYVVHPPR